MNTLDVLMITFSAVAANHLGLVVAIERKVKHRLPIIDCPKCLTFWTVIGYGTLSGLDRFGDKIAVFHIKDLMVCPDGSLRETGIALPTRYFRDYLST